MKKHILLVDDEIEIVSFLEHFLKRSKLSILKATSGEEALRIYDKNKIDFVFLDIQMKGIDGLTVLEKIKSVNPEAKIIMITSKTDLEYQEKARELGALDYIIKPVDLLDLRKKVDKYILQE